MIRVLAVDDEALALERLADLLSKIEGVEIVGTAGSGRAALDQITALAPDAVLLDVEMPMLDGFDVVEELARGGTSAPLIIFVTAYPQFAATAFDSGAIDFLTKPVRLHRLEIAIERLRRAVDERSARARLDELASQLEALRRERGAGEVNHNHLWVQRRGEAIRVDLDALDWVAAEGEYVRLVIGEASFLHRESITAMLDRMDQRRYVRVHRSYIVDIDRVVAVKRLATGSYQLVIDRGVKLPVGRSYRKLVRDMVASGRMTPGS